MNKAQPRCGIRKLCALLSVQVSTYYHAPKPSKRADERLVLIEEIQNIHEEVDKTYGKRRIQVELHAKGYSIGLYKTAQLMKEANVIAIRPRKKHHYTEHERLHRLADNLLKRQFNPDTLNTHYVGDITYVRTYEGWTYLAAVMDLANREIVGWACSQRADANLAITALDRAINQYQPNTDGLLFHSDQGCQYTAQSMCEYLTSKDIIQSMSRRGNCFDNAVMERFFRSLKTERLSNVSILNHEAAIDLIAKYIRFYNYKRRHSANGLIAPAMKRKQMLNVA